MPHDRFDTENEYGQLRRGELARLAREVESRKGFSMPDGDYLISAGGTLIAPAAIETAADASQGKIKLPPATTTQSGVQLKVGVAPTAPADGDLWLTASGVFARVNGVTKQLDAAAAATEYQYLELADYSVTAEDAWEDTNNSLTLAAGTWLVTLAPSVLAQVAATPPGYCWVKLYDETAAADINGALIIAAATIAGTIRAQRPSLTVRLVLTTQSVIAVYAAKESGPTWGFAGLFNGVNSGGPGFTTELGALVAVKVG